MKLQQKKLFLLDMDGTIYLGNKLFPYTKKFLQDITDHGGKFIFLTNNTSKSIGEYVSKLNGMGIFATVPDIITPTLVVAKYLQKYENKKIYALGTTAFCHELRAAGLNIVTALEDDIVCLIMGFDTELTFEKLNHACVLLTQGADYIATNPDLVCPTEFGSVPDCGSVSIMLKNATGREPRFFGKPQPEMVYLALERSGVTKEETIMMGDRLYTDIACGIDAGIDTALVLSGETKQGDIAGSPFKPTYIFQDVGEIKLF